MREPFIEGDCFSPAESRRRAGKSHSEPSLSTLQARGGPWPAWDEELARQGTFVGGSSAVAREWRDEAEREFADRIRVRRYVKYFDRSVLNYNAEGIVGPGVFVAAATSASVFGRWQLIRDVLLIVALSITLVFLVLLSGVTVRDMDMVKVKDLVTDFHTLCTFLLGFFLTTCLNRWWAIRNDCIGGLWGGIDDLSLIVGSYFPDDTAADREVRELVLRWAVLSHELVYKQARAENDLNDLVRRGVLKEHELDILAPLVSKPQVVWAWMCSYFVHLAYGDPARGGSRLPYPVTVLPQLHEICRHARGAIGSAFAYTDTQVPFRYVHFLSLIIWVHNMFQAVNSALVIAEAVQAAQGARICIEMTFLFSYPLIYTGLLHLGVGMLNPLRSKEDVDFPRGAWTYYMLAENRAFFAGNTLPTGPPYGRPPIWKGASTGLA